MEITIKEQQENAIKWLEALLSGKYEQGKNCLGDEDTGYCCWGLGCKIVGIDFSPSDGWDDNLYLHIGYENEGGYIYPLVVKGELHYNSLAQLNDTAGWTFTQIANYLIENAEANFIPEVAEAIKQHFNK